MKYQYLILFIISSLLFSCEEDYPEDYKGKPYLIFEPDVNVGNIYVQKHYNNFYYYQDESITRDTVYIPLSTMAAIADEDLKVSLEAFDSDTLTYPERIDSETINAIPGVHYVPFDDEEVSKNLVFNKGKMQDTIPLIILRDPSLKQATYRLTFRLIDSENSIAADKAENRVVVYISDKVSRPSNWDTWEFGVYGDVKMDFMIRHSELVWDEDDVERVLDDSFLLAYYIFKFKEDLKKENEALGDNGPLKEADGTVVSFDRIYY